MINRFTDTKKEQNQKILKASRKEKRKAFSTKK